MISGLSNSQNNIKRNLGIYGMDEILELKEVTKYYDNLPVLNKISFRVDEGEFVSVIGSSGCGKTTLLKIISGLREPTEGQININNGSVKLALEKRQFGFIFQNPILFPWRNVVKNIELPLEILGNKNPKNSSKDLLKSIGVKRSWEIRYSAISG